MDNSRRTISFRKLAEVLRSSNLKPVQKLLLIDLLLYAGVNNKAFPSQQTLADDLGRSPRYIRSCLKVLHKQDLINWTRRGFAKSNLYTFNEELYYHTDNTNRNSNSHQSGDTFPSNVGTQLPPNVIQLKNTPNVTKKYSSIEDISYADIKEIAFQYKVPEALVNLQLETLRNYCTAKGKRYNNYKAALRNFVLKEAKALTERRSINDIKRGIDARHIK